MPKVKQDKAKAGRLSPSHSPEIQIPLALVTEPAVARPVSATPRSAAKRTRLALVVSPVVGPTSSRVNGRATPSTKSRPVAKAAAPAPAPSPKKAAAKAGKGGGPSARPSGRRATIEKGTTKKAARLVRADTGRASVAPGKPARKGSERKPARATRPAAKPVAKSRPVKPLRKGSPMGAAKKRGPKVGKHLEQRKPERVVLVKELDPFARCGPRTSVEHLIRVEERLDGQSSVHLVFFDRHGWYCEHGKACRAVDDVRRHGKQLGLTF